MRASGEAEKDIILRAHELYATRNDEKHFKEEHAWLVLCDEPKWSVDYLDKINRCNASSGSSKRSRSTGGGDILSLDTPTSAFSVNPIECSMGIKKYKRKGKEAMSSDQAAQRELAHEMEKEEAEKFNKIYELQVAKEIHKREKLQGYNRVKQMELQGMEKVKKMEILDRLMSTAYLPPEGKKLKMKLFKELADESSP